MHYLVCFPRSGSSYVCNVIEQSTGRLARPLQPFNMARADQVVLLKSHASSPVSLLRNLVAFDARRYGIERLRPRRTLVLWRDPRDTLISYYEYLCVRMSQRLDQSEYLVGPAPTWEGDESLVGQRGGRIIDRYRHFVEGWKDRQHDSILHLRFEDLIAAPERQFARIFDFLGLGSAPDPALFGQRVNLVSEDERPRAKVGGWRQVRQRYAELLEVLEAELDAQKPR